ncbi:MAG: hypothetical protein WBY94_17755 [Polyangiaceae bacterium]
MFIATPCYRGEPSEATKRTAEGIHARHGGLWRILEGCPWVGNARSELVAEFLDTGEAEMLWLDADISFDPDVVDRMLALSAPVVLCRYLARKPPYVFVEGLGCTLVQRHVFERLWADCAERLTYLRDCNDRPAVHIFAHSVGTLSGQSRMLGEDGVFFRRCRAAGFQVRTLATATIVHDGIAGTYSETQHLLGSNVTAI